MGYRSRSKFSGEEWLSDNQTPSKSLRGPLQNETISLPKEECRRTPEDMDMDGVRMRKSHIPSTRRMFRRQNGGWPVAFFVLGKHEINRRFVVNRDVCVGTLPEYSATLEKPRVGQVAYVREH